MAKQTFTTGQVLTAAQMTSLQQTAMGGGAATAKTANYVLVAADAGTTVAMNAAGSTTITVNTGLFAAGDTVFIQNLGAGACTVTAGTATVATAGSLILPQNDAGILYFTATGAAIFYDYIQAGAVSPLTTKGDLYTFSTSDQRIGVGANATVLTADSAEATGLKWATPSAAAASFSLLNSGGTTLSGAASRTISGISGQGTLMIILENASCAGAGGNVRMRLNGDTGSNYWYSTVTIDLASTYGVANFYGQNGLVDEFQYIGGLMADAAETSIASVIINGCNSSGIKIMQSVGAPNSDASANRAIYIGQGQYRGTSTISSVTVSSGSGNFDGGTVYVYGSAV